MRSFVAAFADQYKGIANTFVRLIEPRCSESENVIELNYAAYLKPYLMCQPVLQYYWDVGGNSRVPDAAVMGFGVIIDF